MNWEFDSLEPVAVFVWRSDVQCSTLREQNFNFPTLLSVSHPHTGETHFLVGCNAVNADG